MVKDHGEAMAESWVAIVLAEADAMVGAKNPPNVIAMWARMLIQQWGHRSAESIVMAVRDGMCSKVYGALTYPQISEWMQAHEDRIMNLVHSETARHKFTGDNLGSSYLDALERGSKETILTKEIQRLRKQLNTNKQ